MNPPNIGLTPLGADVILLVSGDADCMVADDIYEAYLGLDFFFSLIYSSLKTFLAISGLLNRRDFIACGGGGGRCYITEARMFLLFFLEFAEFLESFES